MTSGTVFCERGIDVFDFSIFYLSFDVLCM